MSHPTYIYIYIYIYIYKSVLISLFLSIYLSLFLSQSISIYLGRLGNDFNHWQVSFFFFFLSYPTFVIYPIMFSLCCLFHRRPGRLILFCFFVYFISYRFKPTTIYLFKTRATHFLSSCAWKGCFWPRSAGKMTKDLKRQSTITKEKIKIEII